jgi:hypothetical protein
MDKRKLFDLWIWQVYSKRKPCPHHPFWYKIKDSKILLKICTTLSNCFTTSCTLLKTQGL